MKKLLILTIPLILSACVSEISSPVAETNYSSTIQLDPFTELPLPTQKNTYMPNIFMQTPKSTNTKNLEVLNLKTKELPLQPHPCYNIVTTNYVYVATNQYEYNGWWLSNTLNNTSANFYCGFLVNPHKKCAG
jgi:hypothetical protein